MSLPLFPFLFLLEKVPRRDGLAAKLTLWVFGLVFGASSNERRWQKGETKRSVFIGRHMSYHGNTLSTLSVGHHPVRRAPYEAIIDQRTFQHVSFVPLFLFPILPSLFDFPSSPYRLASPPFPSLSLHARLVPLTLIIFLSSLQPRSLRTPRSPRGNTPPVLPPTRRRTRSQDSRGWS